MAPKPLTSWRQVNIKWDSIKFDPEKKTWTFTTEFGHTITSLIEPMITVNQTIEYPEYPSYSVQFNYKPIKVKPLEGAKNLQQIREVLKDRNILENTDKFDDVMIGFVYANNTDPMNHTWMFQFRKNGQVMGVMNYLNINVKNCPMKTFAWFENEIWHLRFVVKREDIKSLQEYELNKALLIGKGVKKTISETSEDIPKEYDKIRMRCNVQKNFWITDFLDKKKNIIKSFNCQDMKCSAPVYGEADFDHAKPWVSQYALKKEVENVQILDDMIVIQGKVKP